jgi:cell division protein FtsB
MAGRRDVSPKRWQITWPVVIATALMLLGLLVYGLTLNSAHRRALNEQEASLQQRLSRKEEIQLSLAQQVEDIGSKSYIERHARSDYAYLKPGEMRFEVVNAEVLDNYTQEEWQVILNELQLDE